MESSAAVEEEEERLSKQRAAKQENAARWRPPSRERRLDCRNELGTDRE